MILNLIQNVIPSIVCPPAVQALINVAATAKKRQAGASPVVNGPPDPKKPSTPKAGEKVAGDGKKKKEHDKNPAGPIGGPLITQDTIRKAVKHKNHKVVPKFARPDGSERDGCMNYHARGICTAFTCNKVHGSITDDEKAAVLEWKEKVLIAFPQE
jgi:hypothetical protein